MISCSLHREDQFFMTAGRTLRCVKEAENPACDTKAKASLAWRILRWGR
jgi:hypothetical protein